MKKVIVTTTINPPTEAIKRFASMKDWHLLVVGDLKTPEDAYKGYHYFSPKEQFEKYPELSKLIGWNCIQRRNLGFVEAWNMGAEIIASVDDDNIPYKWWGKEALEPVTATRYTTENAVFDPLSVTEHYQLWHRGFPLQLIGKRFNFKHDKEVKKKFLVQADLWNGDPDVDAICRMMYQPDVAFQNITPYFANKPSPFNSQNTFLRREVLPYFFMFPGIGRMDDIWASYFVQQKFPESVVYCKPSVYQKRNPHNIMSDMQQEMLGYEHTLAFAKKPTLSMLPEQAKLAYKAYGKLLT